MTPLEAVHTTYDNRRVVSQSREEGGVVTGAVAQSWDVRGRPECTALRMDAGRFAEATSACTPQSPVGPHGPDRITKTVYDAADRVSERIVAVGTADDVAVEASAAYTDNGRLRTLTDGNGNLTRTLYDAHDRPSRTMYPVQQAGAQSSDVGNYEELTYDARSLVTQVRLRDGRTIGLAYDALGRLTSKNVPNVAAWEKDTTYAYDDLGRMTGASDGVVDITLG